MIFNSFNYLHYLRGNYIPLRLLLSSMIIFCDDTHNRRISDDIGVIYIGVVCPLVFSGEPGVLFNIFTFDVGGTGRGGGWDFITTNWHMLV